MISVDFLCSDINKSLKAMIGNNILNLAEIPFENQIGQISFVHNQCYFVSQQLSVVCFFTEHGNVSHAVELYQVQGDSSNVVVKYLYKCRHHNKLTIRI